MEGSLRHLWRSELIEPEAIKICMASFRLDAIKMLFAEPATMRLDEPANINP